MKKTIIWILLADSGKARLIERDGPLGKLTELKTFTHGHEKTHEHENDRPGVTFDRGGEGQHSYEPHTDWHEQQVHVFAKELANMLSAGDNAHQFDELYLIAPPKMLGSLREQIAHSSKTLLPKLSKEVPKNATNITLNDLMEYIDRS